jgi:hypothetical protein
MKIKRTGRVSSDDAFIDVTIVVDEQSTVVDVFIKILNAAVLGLGEGFTATYWGKMDLAGISDYVLDITTDPRYNAQSKTFIASYSGPSFALPNATDSHFSIDYFRNTDQYAPDSLRVGEQMSGL